MYRSRARVLRWCYKCVFRDQHVQYSIFAHTKYVSMSSGVDMTYVPTKIDKSLVKRPKIAIFSKNEDEICIKSMQMCVIRDQHKKLV